MPLVSTWVTDSTLSTNQRRLIGVRFAAPVPAPGIDQVH